MFGFNLTLKLGSGVQFVVLVVDGGWRVGGEGGELIFFFKSIFIPVLRLHTEFELPVSPGTGKKCVWWWVFGLGLRLGPSRTIYSQIDKDLNASILLNLQYKEP